MHGENEGEATGPEIAHESGTTVGTSLLRSKPQLTGEQTAQTCAMICLRQLPSYLRSCLPDGAATDMSLRLPLFTPPDSLSIQAEGVHAALQRTDINHPIRHGGRGIHIVAGGIAPLQAEVSNIVEFSTLSYGFQRCMLHRWNSVQFLPVCPLARKTKQAQRIKTKTLVRFMAYLQKINLFD